MWLPCIMFSLGSSTVLSYQVPPDGLPLDTAFVRCSRWFRMWAEPKAALKVAFACVRPFLYISLPT